MNADSISQILRKSDYYRRLTADSRTISIILYGSIPRGDYIEGWSDIDLLIVVDGPSLDYFELVNRFQKNIYEVTSIKTGLEVVSYPLLLKACEKSDYSGGLIKFTVTVFYKNSPALENGILFLRKGKRLPVFSLKFFEKVDLFANVSDLNRYIFKLLPAKESFKNKKELLRKLIKITLPLLKIDVLVTEKKLIDNFESLLNFYQLKRKIDVGVLHRSFQRRFSWKNINDSDIKQSEIDQNWQLFLDISKLLMGKC